MVKIMKFVFMMANDEESIRKRKEKRIRESGSEKEILRDFI